MAQVDEVLIREEEERNKKLLEKESKSLEDEMKLV